jgi:site-specific recombinase XerD
LVYDIETQKQKWYKTEFELSEKLFKKLIDTKKAVTETEQAYRDSMNEMKKLYHAAASDLKRFSFEALEEKLSNKTIEKQNDIESHYQAIIETLTKNKQIGTASSYKYSLKSLNEYCGKPDLEFSDITPEWLKAYEAALLKKGKSRTTIGIYLRPLRAVFNQAVDEKIVTPDLYPFGRRKYEIPAPKAVKKALNKEQLKQLFEAVPLTPEQAKAKDFWFLSYFCNGANIKDLLNWKWADFDGEAITFNRQKTIRTKKDAKPLVVFLNEQAKSIIEKYGNTDRNSKAFMFPILSAADTPQEGFSKVQNFTRFINQNFLKLAKSVGINEPVSTYWARHTFATTAIRKGASLEFIGDALGHSDTKTTIGYFAGFESEAKKQFAQSLMDF